MLFLRVQIKTMINQVSKILNQNFFRKGISGLAAATYTASLISSAVPLKMSTFSIMSWDARQQFEMTSSKNQLDFRLFLAKPCLINTKAAERTQDVTNGSDRIFGPYVMRTKSWILKLSSKHRQHSALCSLHKVLDSELGKLCLICTRLMQICVSK